MYIKNKISSYLCLMRFHQPIGIWLLLYPTLGALFLADHGFVSKKVLYIFIAGVIIMRSLGCVINDICDRKFDIAVWRTKNRPLATKEISLIEAILLTIILATVALFLVLELHNLTILLLAILGIILSIIYPLIKRFSYFPQILLAFLFGALPIIMASVAVTHTISLSIIILAMATYAWQLSYDSIYAIADLKDDQCIGIKSIAVLYKNKLPNIILGLQVIMIILLQFLGELQNFSLDFHFFILLLLLLFYKQYRQIKHMNPQSCFKVFQQHHKVAIYVFVVLLLGIYYK